MTEIGNDTTYDPVILWLFLLEIQTFYAHTKKKKKPNRHVYKNIFPQLQKHPGNKLTTFSRGVMNQTVMYSHARTKY